jgi:hypothetical protein
VPEKQWRAVDVGTVVLVYKVGEVYEVELVPLGATYLHLRWCGLRKSAPAATWCKRAESLRLRRAQKIGHAFAFLAILLRMPSMLAN